MRAVDQPRWNFPQIACIGVAGLLTVTGPCFAVEAPAEEARKEVQDAEPRHEVQDADARHEIQDAGDRHEVEDAEERREVQDAESR